MISKIMAFEADELDNEEMVAFFQELLDTGVIHHLQGCYGRMAQQLIDDGLISQSMNKSARKRAVKRSKKPQLSLPIGVA